SIEAVGPRLAVSYDRRVTRTNTSRRRILIVDDDLGIIEVLKDHLEVLYDAAVDGRDALGRVRQTAPDLIVLDMHLAGLTGLEVLTQVHDVNPKIPQWAPDGAVANSVRRLGCGDAAGASSRSQAASA